MSAYTRPVASATVAIVGTRYPDFGVEHEALGDLGVEIVSGAGRTMEEILDVAADADVILAGAAPRFDADHHRRSALQGIVRYGVGVDSIDLAAAAAAGISVANTPDYGTEAVAVHTLALVLAGIRRLPMAERRLRRGDWGFAELRPLRLPRSMTAGVVGFGRHRPPGRASCSPPSGSGGSWSTTRSSTTSGRQAEVVPLEDPARQRRRGNAPSARRRR